MNNGNEHQVNTSGIIFTKNFITFVIKKKFLQVQMNKHMYVK